jgi:hypothetical protein
VLKLTRDACPKETVLEEKGLVATMKKLSRLIVVGFLIWEAYGLLKEAIRELQRP